MEPGGNLQLVTFAQGRVGSRKARGGLQSYQTIMEGLFGICTATDRESLSISTLSIRDAEPPDTFIPRRVAQH